MRLKFNDAREVLALCVHVMGTWALGALVPSLSAFFLLVLSRAERPCLL